MQPTEFVMATRFGTGMPLPDGAPSTVPEMLALLAGPDVMAQRYRIARVPEVLPMVRAIDIAVKKGEGEAALEERRLAIEQVNAGLVRGTRSTFARSVDTVDGFRERLVRFWADHFTTVTRNQRERMLPLAMAEDAIRPHLNGRFSAMLQAVTLHPSMLTYLDQVASVGPNSPYGRKSGRGLNENLGREVIELHTIGVGDVYTQQDVTAMAELLTGLFVDLERGTVFRANRAEPGAETVLGRSFEGEGLDPIRAGLDALATHPATARHIAHKLAIHFISDDPDPQLVATMEAAFRDTDGDLPAVYAAMLDNPAAWAMPATKARQPYDFLAASFRAIGVSGERIIAMDKKQLLRLIQNPLRDMGQAFLTASGPNGWPEDADAWITPQGLAARILWAMNAPSDILGDMLPDPETLLQRALGDAAGDRLRRSVPRAESQREAVGLILASPEFNRR